MLLAVEDPILRATSFEAEIQALRIGLQCAIENGYLQLICQVYSQALRNILSTQNFDKTNVYAKALIKDIISLSSQFQNLSAEWHPREVNSVADYLAKQASNNANLKISIQSVNLKN